MPQGVNEELQQNNQHENNQHENNQHHEEHREENHEENHEERHQEENVDLLGDHQNQQEQNEIPPQENEIQQGNNEIRQDNNEPEKKVEQPDPQIINNEQPQRADNEQLRNDREDNLQNENMPFDLNQISRSPDMWRRLTMPTGADGSMGSVFQGTQNPFMENSTEAMNKIKGLAATGNLYLREKGTNTFREIQKEGESYRLGDPVTREPKGPYDIFLGNLILLADRYFDGIFGRKWFSEMADKYRAYRDMDSNMKTERAEHALEEEKAQLAKEYQQAQELKAQKKAAKEKAKQEKKARKAKEKAEKAKAKKAKKQKKENADADRAAEGGAAQKQQEPKAQEKQPAEKPKPSVQQPNAKAIEKKQALKEKLKAESDAWKANKDWKKTINDKLFHGNDVLKAKYNVELDQGAYLLGCVAGVFGRGAEANGGADNHKKMLNGILDRGGYVGSEFDRQLQDGVQAYQSAMNEYGSDNRAPLEKMLHDAAMEMVKAASDAPELSERHHLITNYLNEIKVIAERDNLDLKFTEDEQRAMTGAMEMGVIATRGANARQALGKAENIDWSNPRTKELLGDYMNMMMVNAGMKYGAKDPTGISSVQNTLGAGGDWKTMSRLTQESGVMQVFLASAGKDGMLQTMLDDPNGRRGMMIGKNLLAENSLELAKELNAAQQPVEPVAELELNPDAIQNQIDNPVPVVNVVG